MSQSQRTMAGLEAIASTESTDCPPSQADYAQKICEVAEKLGYAHEYTRVMEVLMDASDPRNQPIYPGARITIIQAVTLQLHLFVTSGPGGSSSVPSRMMWRTVHSLLPTPNKMPNRIAVAEKMIKDLLSDSVKSD
uniref:Uncharacterized protein n=1 Tax=Branchiostoma floridae TaxID=7739 RepID=C3Z993_BRAFL|eukprot:XP_002594811.1 hypothetical protein BRAFLDRAFT_100605 [Branchiostoma floridae]